MLHAGAFTSGFTEASNSEVVPPQTLQLHTDIMLQPSSLWRRMLRYRSMLHIKKPLIMHVDYRQALRRRCCAWSRSMADGYAALLLACDAFDVSCKLISNLSCVVSTAPHRIISIFELSWQRLHSNSIMECVSAIDVAGDGRSNMCWKSSSVSKHKMYVTVCASVVSPYHICR